MLDARKDLRAYETYYKKYLTGYENMFLSATANTLGVRESRRIVCENTLKSVHYDTCAVFDDEIGRYSYPRDIHNESASEDAVEKFRKRINACHGKGQSYGIPYGALTPRKLENVLTAGKCIGTDREMQASVRVIPGCYITGQAAGMAAAIACDCDGNVKCIDIEKLQHALLKIGAFLPNFKN